MGLDSGLTVVTQNLILSYLDYKPLTMHIKFTDILSIVVIFQLLFLFVFLVSHRKGKRVSNVLLGLFFLAVCLNFTDGLLILNNAYLTYPSFAFIGNNFSLLFGPLLYFYTKAVIYKDFRLKPGMLLHAVPFLLFLLFAVLSYHIQSASMKRFILNAAAKQQTPVVLYIIGILLYAQFYSYTVAALRLVKQYKSTISNRFSEINKINLDWLRSTIFLFMVVIRVGVLNAYIPLTPLINYFSITLSLIIISIFLFINRILLKALRHPESFEGRKEEDTIETPTEELTEAPGIPLIHNEHPVQKYAGSLLTDTEKAEVKATLIAYMQKERPFLEPQLTIEELADMLKIKPRILSQVINECLNQNFFDFINRYRIEEAKRLLANPADPKITVLEVLYQVGFNSKSSFNTLFKKYTGLTPSEFKNKNAPL
jgi:AraC-like DNA-binding protein